MKQGLTSLNFSPPKACFTPHFAICHPRNSLFCTANECAIRIKALSISIFLLSFGLASGHFLPFKCSLSPPKVIIFPPQCGHLRTKSAVENWGTALKEGKNQGEIGNLEAKCGGRLLWLAPKSSVRPTADNSRRLLFPCFRRQVRHDSPFFRLSMNVKHTDKVLELATASWMICRGMARANTSHTHIR